MTASVAHIWRHPIKAHGREALERVAIEAGQTMPLDRAWAVMHDKSKAIEGEWSTCGNFSRAARTPTLQAIEAKYHEPLGMLSLTHPDLEPISFNPDVDGQKFIDWVKPLMADTSFQSTKLIPAGPHGMTDSDFPTLSLNNLSTHQAVSAHLGQDLSPVRWRGNIWFAGLDPWEERSWIGKSVRIGTAEFEIREEIGRCTATTVNPATGNIDVDTLKALRELIGEQNFGVYAYPIKSGRIALGDKMELL